MRIELPRTGRIRGDQRRPPPQGPRGRGHGDPTAVLQDEGGKKLYTNRTRLAPEYWMVRARPEWFTPAMAGDKATANRMRDMLRRAELAELREIDRQRGPRRRGTWRLPDAPPRAWRLP